MTDQQSARPRVLVADPIAAEGLAILRGFAEVDERAGLGAEGLVDAIPDYDGLVVRSETKVTAAAIEAGAKLRIIARAGVGVDNIDVEAATRRGVVVVNSPTGNIVAAAEHTVALLLALARRIPIANEALRQGRWERSKFVGAALRFKTRRITGQGRVGPPLSGRAGENGLGMRLLAHDPYASPDNARKLNAELVSLDELLEQSDFVTVHTVLNAGTRGLLSVDELAKMKPSARIINCARGGVVDEEALLDALREGRLAGAALDVFTTEPPFNSPTLAALIERPDVVVTPHLGASTEEAQVSVAVDVAEQMRDVFRGGAPRAAVNAPLILPETLRQLAPWMALVEKLGRLYTQLHPGALKRVEFGVAGEIAQFDTRPLTTALIKGLLEPVSEAHVNLVNAQVVAREWGMVVVESRSTTHEQYANLVTVRVSPDGDDGEAEQRILAGTVAWGEERIVRVDRYLTDFAPRGHLLLARNLDRPGMIGVVGVILGDAGVNIAHMDVGPVALGDATGRARQPGGEALMALSLDDAVPEAALDKIRHADGIMDVRSVEL
jgi:D-3-phosphoglycerate dehydrogenase